jgi:hypothetical protein
MPKVFPENEKEVVYRLSDEGLSNVQIAERMKEDFPANWSTKSGDRAAARILSERKESTVLQQEKTLDEMTRDERFKYISARLQGTPRFRMAFTNFNNEEKEVFVDEYLKIVKATDSLTEVEEQALFASILELVLAFQALSRKEREEKLFQKSLDGEFVDGDPQFRRFVDERYHKEYDQHMKLYNAGIKTLKMSREQRLKEVRSERRTLVDLAEELSHKTTQAEVANEIERLSKASDEELKKMLENGHVFGDFRG